VRRTGRSGHRVLGGREMSHNVSRYVGRRSQEHPATAVCTRGGEKGWGRKQEGGRATHSTAGYVGAEDRGERGPQTEWY